MATGYRPETYVTYEGYWGHGIRMGYKGKASPDLNRYFEAILEVQNAGMRELVPGKPLRAAAKAMEVAVEENCPYERGHDLMRFRPGHGLGLNYSDPLVTDAFPQPEHWSAGPESAHESKLTVQPGMVIELHPNFSVPELGVISIGDMVLVTEIRSRTAHKDPQGAIRHLIHSGLFPLHAGRETVTGDGGSSRFSW